MTLQEDDFEFWGDYLNPKLEIQFEKNKGIKIIAKENIKLGELILVEKSLAYQKDNEEIGRVYKLKLKDLNNKDVSMTEEDIDLFNELAEKLIKYPLDYEKFYYLYDGNNLNEDINQRKQYLKNQIDGKIKLTKEKIANVIFHNKYQLGRNFIYYRPISKGIWGYASLINSDCLPNSAYFCIGKFLFHIV